MLRKGMFTLKPGEPKGLVRYTSVGKKVVGVVDVSNVPDTVSIYEWTSNETGRGHTRRALQELRQVASYIVVIGIGSDSSDGSWQYWRHLYDAGLVDELLDDDDVIVAQRRRSRTR